MDRAQLSFHFRQRVLRHTASSRQVAHFSCQVTQLADWIQHVLMGEDGEAQAMLGTIQPKAARAPTARLKGRRASVLENSVFGTCHRAADSQPKLMIAERTDTANMTHTHTHIYSLTLIRFVQNAKTDCHTHMHTHTRTHARTHTHTHTHARTHRPQMTTWHALESL